MLLPFFPPSFCLLVVVAFFFLDTVLLFWLCPWAVSVCPDTGITITWSKARTKCAQARHVDASQIQPEITIPESLQATTFETTSYSNFQGLVHLPKQSKVESSLLPGRWPILFPGCSAKRRQAGGQILENKVVEINCCQNATVFKNNTD